MAKKKPKTEEKKPRKIAKSLSKVYNAGPTLQSNGLFSYGGRMLNPDEIGLSVYEKMLDNDETCSSGIEIVSTAVLSRLGEYTHENSKIQDYILRQFEVVRGSFLDKVKELFTALWAGFAVSEMVLVPDGTEYQLIDIQNLDPGTIEFVLHDEGFEKNRIKSVTQQSSLAIEIPVEKLIIYTHRSRFGNPYGQSRFRQLYKLWYFKDQMLPFWGRTLESYGRPTAVASVANPDDVIEDENGDSMTRMDLMVNILDSLQNSTSLVVSEDDKVEFLQVKASLGDDYEKAITWANKMIYRGLMIPALVGDQGKVGSQALGNVHFDTFLLALDDLRDDITEVLIDQLIRPLITWQFGDQDEWGCFQKNEFKPEDAQIFSNIFAQATSAGYLTSDSFKDLSHVREKLGLPGLTQAEFAQQQAEKEEKERQRQEELEKRLEQQGKDKGEKDQKEEKNEKTERHTFVDELRADIEQWLAA